MLLPDGVMDEMEIFLSSISSMAPAGSNIGGLYHKLYSQVFLMMGENIARNM